MLRTAATLPGSLRHQPTGFPKRATRNVAAPRRSSPTGQLRRKLLAVSGLFASGYHPLGRSAVGADTRMYVHNPPPAAADKSTPPLHLRV